MENFSEISRDLLGGWGLVHAFEEESGCMSLNVQASLCNSLLQYLVTG